MTFYVWNEQKRTILEVELSTEQMVWVNSSLLLALKQEFICKQIKKRIYLCTRI
ncbi:hypothetical protein VAE151_520295 [Vibrio aestuarianus]|nr:hypothetical protein VAE308_1010297 [Vibrio aestuarianus]CAH8186724.1 hypothetical protein VAE032_240296 [Vibrio aestuarianus]CAH8186823.1 hypothetical protein VAE055_340297 [Vibrio aestuarianus]CAH8186983.1 hypothetical protein VAE130_550299 [Vibrio aestuarianus]CAH8187144.1 hypothetical protein VAE115_290299 [Vibrio aestuarianus]